MATPTRRAVIQGAAAAGALALLGCRRGPSPAAPAVARDASKTLSVRLDEPYCAEPPLGEMIRSWITPVPLFYVINHGSAPRLDARRWTLEITGQVRRTVRLGLADLQQLPELTIPATLMCAGNRRLEHHAHRAVRDRVIWDAGAVGNAWWTGVRLDDVLVLAGVEADARHV